MNEQITKIVRHPIFVPAVTGVVCSAAGFTLGYILGKNKPTIYFKTNEITQQEFQFPEYDPNQRFQLSGNWPVANDDKTNSGITFEIGDAKSFTDELMEKGKEFVENALDDGLKVDQSQTPVHHSIFASNGDDDWDYDEEINNRTIDQPFVIHRDEYFENELNYKQHNLTYYEGDEVLCSDEENVPIYGWNAIIGPLKFGHGSGDPKIFYVRNTKLRSEYEIIHDSGHFIVEVMGMEIEHDAEEKDLKHSERRKFRDSD